MKTRKLNIFKILYDLDTKNIKSYDKDTEEEQAFFEKNLQLYIIMRWMSGTKNGIEIYLLNDLVNTNVFTFGKDHKRLLYYLLSVCTNGRKQTYRWISKQKDAKYPKSVACLKQYFHYSTKEAQDAFPLLTSEDIIDYAYELGFQLDEVKAIVKELKD